MLTVITMVSSDTPKAWVSQCRASVRVAADRAGFPVDVLETAAVPGNIGMAMYGAMQACRTPYMAWVDDDDFVLPNAFSCLAPHWRKEPTAVCAREIQLLANGHLRPCELRHHLTAWRRDILEDAALEDRPSHPLVPLLAAVRESAADEMSWVYVRRRRLSGGAVLRRAHGRASI